MLNKRDKYLDENGEMTLFSAGGQITKDFLSAMSGCFIFGSELYDLISSAITGDKYYGLEIASLQTVSDILEDFSKVGDLKNFGENSLNIFCDLCTFLGVPAQNALNIFYGIKGNTERVINQTMLAPDYANMADSKKAVAMYNAILSKDQEKYAKIYNTFISQGKDSKDIKKYIKTILVSRNLEIKSAAQALIDNNFNVYNENVEKLINDGFDSETIISAVKSKKNEMIKESSKKEDTEDVDDSLDNTLDEEENSFDNSKSKSNLYDKDMLWDELLQGDKTDYQKIYKELLKQGETKSKIEQSINSRKNSLVEKYVDITNKNSNSAQEYYNEIVNVYGNQASAKSAIKKAETAKKQKQNK